MWPTDYRNPRCACTPRANQACTCTHVHAHMYITLNPSFVSLLNTAGATFGNQPKQNDVGMVVASFSDMFTCTCIYGGCMSVPSLHTCTCTCSFDFRGCCLFRAYATSYQNRIVSFFIYTERLVRLLYSSVHVHDKQTSRHIPIYKETQHNSTTPNRYSNQGKARQSISK